VATAKKPTPEETFYADWARESIRHNLDLANDILRQLITLNTALLGGSVLFLDEHLVPSPLRFLAILSFLVALILSFLGVLPYEGQVDIRNITAVREHKQKAFRHKHAFLWYSAFGMALGFGFAIAGLLIKQICT